MKDLGVRVGTPEDIDELMKLAMSACDENGFVEPNPQKLLSELWHGLVLADGIVGVIGGVGEKLEGAVLLRISEMWYSDSRILEEKAIFIHPDYRSAKGGRARRLVEFAKRCAGELDIPLLIGVLSNDRTEAKVRMYERQFGKATGAFFLYNARTGMHKMAAE
jgi:GNAT superfamily N-acetyltransferase